MPQWLHPFYKTAYRRLDILNVVKTLYVAKNVLKHIFSSSFIKISVADLYLVIVQKNLKHQVDSHLSRSVGLICSKCKTPSALLDDVWDYFDISFSKKTAKLGHKEGVGGRNKFHSKFSLLFLLRPAGGPIHWCCSLFGILHQKYFSCSKVHIQERMKKHFNINLKRKLGYNFLPVTYHRLQPLCKFESCFFSFRSLN